MLHKQDSELKALKFIYDIMGKKSKNQEFLDSMNTDT
jgi:hypothetical protein